MFYNSVKSILDKVFSIILLILLSPLFLLIYILIRSTNSSRVLFRQKRIGLYGKEFLIYKFRSMYPSTPDYVPTSQLPDSDSCITPIGRILRDTSIDELPQLINILKGEMSFIGPRPVIPCETELNDLRSQNGIFMIRPGITGYAQVNGRDRVNARDKAMMDKYYQENLSFSLDMKILFLTIRNVLTIKDIHEGSDQEAFAISFEKGRGNI